jgi:hypothetical protein
MKGIGFDKDELLPNNEAWCSSVVQTRLNVCEAFGSTQHLPLPLNQACFGQLQTYGDNQSTFSNVGNVLLSLIYRLQTQFAEKFCGKIKSWRIFFW